MAHQAIARQEPTAEKKAWRPRSRRRTNLTQQVQSRQPGPQHSHKQETVGQLDTETRGEAFLTKKFYHIVVISQADELN